MFLIACNIHQYMYIHVHVRVWRMCMGDVWCCVEDVWCVGLCVGVFVSLP